MPAEPTTTITATSIVGELRSLGKEGYKRILLKHGIPEPLFGVSVENLKKILKRIKQDHRLSLDLYRTGIYDARYLAGLIADPAQMTKRDLQSIDWSAPPPLPARGGSRGGGRQGRGPGGELRPPPPGARTAPLPVTQTVPPPPGS